MAYHFPRPDSPYYGYQSDTMDFLQVELPGEAYIRSREVTGEEGDIPMSILMEDFSSSPFGTPQDVLNAIRARFPDAAQTLTVETIYNRCRRAQAEVLTMFDLIDDLSSNPATTCGEIRHALTARFPDYTQTLTIDEVI